MFRSKPGDVSPRFRRRTLLHLQVADKRSSGTRPLNRMETEAKASLIRSLRMQRAKEAAEQARATLAAGAKETEVAARLRGKVVTADGVTRNGFINGVPLREPRAVGAMFAMPLNTWSPAMVGESGVLVALVERHTVATEEEFRKQEQQVRENLLGERRQVLFVEWMQDLRRHAKIKDYRGQYFEV